MIPKISSKEMSEILAQSKESIVNIENDMNATKADLSNKLLVIKNEQEYAIQELASLKELLTDGAGNDLRNKIVFARQSGLGGKYDMFGTTIHPAFTKTPNNIFNFGTSAGAIFKNNANVRINNKVSESAKAMLMHDSIAGKGVAFAEYDSPTLKLEVELNVGDLLGDTAFNMIELAPFLPGSFTINSVEVYKIQSYMTQATLPDLQISQPITKVGASRILLDARYSLYKCVFNITLHYKNRNGKYPFGLRHLYFLNADFNRESYVVARIEKNRFIDWISDDLYVRDQNRQYKSSCAAEGIKVYMSYNNDILEYEVLTSKGLSENIIARNTKELYVKIPLTRGMISISFDKIADR